MVKYLTISLLINLLIFSFYSYWVGKTLQNTLQADKFLTPLILTIHFQRINLSEERSKNQIESNFNSSFFANGKSSRQTSQSGNKEKPSLLSELLPVVKEEYQITYRKIKSYATARLSKAGKMKISVNRKLIYIPPIRPLKVEYPPTPVEVKITVLPDGRVIDTVLLKRSGNAKVDKAILQFVKNLRFAPIDEPIIQEIYIEFKFKY